MSSLALRVFLVLVSCSLLLPSQDATAGQGAQDKPELVIPSETADDRALASALLSIYRQVESFVAIEVRCRGGVVMLGGRAPSPGARAEAIEIARKQKGVVYVDDQIDVPAKPTGAGSSASDVRTVEDQRIQTKLQSVFSRVPELSSLNVSVAAGVVRLEGEVASKSAKERALELTQKTSGVVFIDDAIAESTALSDRLSPTVDRMFEFIRDFFARIPLFALAMLVFFGAWWIARRVGNSQSIVSRLGSTQLIRSVLSQILKTAIVLLGLFVALEILDATALVGAVLGTAGVVGLAIGFAFRDIVENYLASILLSIRQPFKTKDFVDIGGRAGTVIRLTTRSTVLMTSDGNHLILPNADVFKSSILNYTTNPLRRFDVGIGVGTDVDLEDAKRLGLEVLALMKGVVDDPEPVARVESLGDSNVQLRFYGWVDQRDASFAKVKSQAVRLLKSIMEENDIDMPIPTYQLKLDRMGTKATLPPEVVKRRSLAEAREQARVVDILPEDEIEKQVDEELRSSEEDDLLNDDAATESPEAAKA